MGAMESLDQLGPRMETLEALYLPQFPDSCSVLSCGSALCTVDYLWPLGECVVGGGGVPRGPGAMRIGGSALGSAANSCFPISSFYGEAAIAPFPFPSFSLDCGKINILAGSCLCFLNSSSLNGRIPVLLPPYHLGDNSLLSCPRVLSGRIQVSAGNTLLLILDPLLVSLLPSTLVRG